MLTATNNTWIGGGTLNYILEMMPSYGVLILVLRYWSSLSQSTNLHSASCQCLTESYLELAMQDWTQLDALRWT